MIKYNKFIILFILAVIIFVIVCLEMKYHYIDIIVPRGDYSHKEYTDAQLNMLFKMMMLYKNDFGTWPSRNTWKHDLEPYKYKDTEDAYNDGWGNPIQYVDIVKEGNSVVKLYSFGENGIDENGLNDDLVLDVLELEKEVLKLQL